MSDYLQQTHTETATVEVYASREAAQARRELCTRAGFRTDLFPTEGDDELWTLTIHRGLRAIEALPGQGR